MQSNLSDSSQPVAARRQRQRNAPAGQAQPGPRASLLAWLKSGRLVSLVIFLASCVALGLLFSDPRFSITRIEVEGNSALNAEAIAELANLEGRSIWFIDRELAVARLKENAYIASAAVQVIMPDLARIKLVERRPEVRWQAGGMQYLVDGTGKVLSAAQDVAPQNVLVINDNSHLQLNPNDELDLDAIRLAQALALRLPVELGFNPSQIGWDYGLGIYVRSTSGQTIIFGQSEALDRKLAIFKALLNDQTAFSYLDLRPDNPFYQYNPAALGGGTPAP